MRGGLSRPAIAGVAVVGTVGIVVAALSACSSSRSSASSSPAPAVAAAASSHSAVTVPGTSMEPTLKPGQVVEVTDLAPGRYQPHRGDVVLFTSPSGWFDPGTGAFDELKRVIGIPGDHVACPGPGRPVTVNGVALSEPYVAAGDEPSMEPFDVTVPSGDLWVMGDHRDVSEDSRAHNRAAPGSGFVPAAVVIGVYGVR